jgi:hypothetical protein
MLQAPFRHAALDSLIPEAAVACETTIGSSADVNLVTGADSSASRFVAVGTLEATRT